MEKRDEEQNKVTNNKFSMIDKFNLGFNILNLSLIIVSVLIARYAIKSNEEIAMKSGAFDKGVLDLSFGGYFLIPNKPYDVYYGVNFGDSTLHFATLPLTIHNTGKKTIDNVSLLIKYPHLANLAILDSIIKFEFKTTLPDKLERKFISDKPYDEVAYYTNAINPNLSIEVGDLFSLQHETLGAQSVSVPTDNSDSVTIVTTYAYGYKVIVGLMAKDIITKSFDIRLNFRNEIDLNRLIKVIIDEKVKNKGNSITHFFVVIPKTNQIIGEKSYRMTFMKSDESTTLFCQFDKELENVAVFNQDGTLQKIIEINRE